MALCVCTRVLCVCVCELRSFILFFFPRLLFSEGVFSIYLSPQSSSLRRPSTHKKYVYKFTTVTSQKGACHLPPRKNGPITKQTWRFYLSPTSIGKWLAPSLSPISHKKIYDYYFFSLLRIFFSSPYLCHVIYLAYQKSIYIIFFSLFVALPHRLIS